MHVFIAEAICAIGCDLNIVQPKMKISFELQRGYQSFRQL